MKNFLWIHSASLAAVFLGWCLSGARAEEGPGSHGNLLVNGSFDNGMEGWVVSASSSKGLASIDEKEMRAGRATLRIENQVADDTHVKQKVKVKPGTRYRISGYIKTKDVLALKKGGRNGGSLAMEGGYEKTPVVMGTKGWTQVSHDFDTGRETEIEVSARLGFYNGLATGVAWYSDLSLVEVGKARNGG